MKVALIGLGRMGAGIAQNMVKHGLELIVWNRTTSKLAPIVALGAKAAGSAKEAASSTGNGAKLVRANQRPIEQTSGPEGCPARSFSP